MNSRDFKDKVLEIKKKRFLDGVVRAAKSLGVHTPKVQFWEDKCPDDTGNEMAHIHPELALICVAEKRLKEMTYDDIEETATHEVTHLSDKTPETNPNHSPDFYRRHDDVKVSSWRPEGAGVVVIDGGARTSKTKHKKEKHTIDKKICNRWGQCEEKTHLNECEYCKNWYCYKHHTPFEPGSIFNSGDKGHPCPAYVDHNLKLKEEQDKKYQANLKKVISSENEFDSTNYRHPDITAKMAADEPVDFREYQYGVYLRDNSKEEIKITVKNKKPTLWNRIKCFFGFHQLEKLGGPVNYGGGEFMQKYVCKRCKKVIERIS